MQSPSDPDRFLALVCRELGADDARVASDGETLSDDGRELSCALSDGRTVVARFAQPPADREAKQRRLEMLAGTFVAVAAAGSARRSRPPVARSLVDELEALRARAAALNAFVIDANSPVVWAAAHPEGLFAPVPIASSSRLAEAANTQHEEDDRVKDASRRALHAVRALPDLAAMRKGKHLRYVARGGEAPLLATSFASIYLLVLAFEAPFDELRAERAMTESLPVVERLVLALPPLDPAPGTGAGVISMRRRRR